MKKLSPSRMKEVSLPTPHTLTPTPSFKSGEEVLQIDKLAVVIKDRKEGDTIAWQQAREWPVNAPGKIGFTIEGTTKVTPQTPYLVHPSCGGKQPPSSAKN